MKNRSSYLLLILTASFLLVGAGMAQTQHYSYKIRYGMIQAGHADLSYYQVADTVNGFLSIKSSPWLSSVWSLADTIENRFEITENRLLSHRKSVNQGKYNRRYQVNFPSNDTAMVNSKPVAIDGPVMDVPQLIHSLRYMDLEPGDTLFLSIWDGKESGDLTLLVKKPTISLDLNPLTKPPKILELRPLESTRKSREHGLRLKLHVRDSKPHDPERIEIETRYGNLEMLRER